MRTPYEVWLDGVGLSSIDPDIAVLDIREGAPKCKLGTAVNGKYDGLRVTSRVRQSLSVTVTFCVRIYDPVRRAMVIDRVLDWCRDGVLEVSYRPGQRLRVLAGDLPALGSANQWTEGVSATFTAYACPYWENAIPTTVVTNTASATHKLTICPIGTLDTTFLAFSAKVASGTLQTLTMACGSSTLTLDGMTVPAGATVTLDYDMEGRIRIRSAGTSLLGKRLGTSADDIILLQRQANTVSITADAPVFVTLSARGRYR